MLNKVVLCSGLLLLLAGGASAGSIDRSGQGLGALFETGHYAEISLSQAMPSVKGVDVRGGTTGNVAGSFLLPSMSVKVDANERLSFALVAEQTYGADLLYASSSTLLGGTMVDETSYSLLGLARYKIDDNFSVHGGWRVQNSSATIRLKGLAFGAVSGYQVHLGADTASAPVVGFAYEMRDIALRVAATYHAGITHKLKTQETAPLASLNGSSTTAITTPRAINLDFQTGIAPDTLLFGQLRWVNWSEFRVAPERLFALLGEGLIELKDTRTWTLGLGRQINERWGAAVSYNYESSGDPLSSPLSPVNGRRGVTLALHYTQDKMKITTGISRTWLGDAKLETGTPDTQRATMSGNKSLNLGVKVGRSF